MFLEKLNDLKAKCIWNFLHKHALLLLIHSFEETEEQPPEQPHREIEGSPDKSATFDNRRRRRRSASDVRKWLLRKPSMSKKKKDKEIKPAVVAVGKKISLLFLTLIHCLNLNFCHQQFCKKEE